MLKELYRLFNNPRSGAYIIFFYIAASMIFGLIYYAALPLIEGTPSLEYNTEVKKHVDNFFECFYFSITSQTTVGYGDIIPGTSGARLCAMIQTVFGFFYLAFTISFFTAKRILKSDKFEMFLLNYSNITASDFISDNTRGIH